MIPLNLQTLLSNDRLANIIRYSEMVKDLEGDVAEFGVFRGGTLELLAQLHPSKRVIGIDSFEGLPYPSEKDTHKLGDFNEVDYAAIYGYFKTLFLNVQLHKGFSPGVFNNLHPHRMYSFVHIDVDLYQSVKDGLDYFYPRMIKGGVILLDDYGWQSTPGAKIAVDEFIKYLLEGEAKKIDDIFGCIKELRYYKNGPSHKQFLIIK